MDSILHSLFFHGHRFILKGKGTHAGHEFGNPGSRKGLRHKISDIDLSINFLNLELSLPDPLLYPEVLRGKMSDLSKSLTMGDTYRG